MPVQNYNGVPIPNPHSRPELAMPVIAPGNLMFYRGTQTFRQWNGNGVISGLAISNAHIGATGCHIDEMATTQPSG